MLKYLLGILFIAASFPITLVVLTDKLLYSDTHNGKLENSGLLLFDFAFGLRLIL